MKALGRFLSVLIAVAALICLINSAQVFAQGNALSFDGDDVVTFGSVTPIGSHTIEAWVKPELSAGQFQIIAGYTGGPTLACNVGMYLGIDTTTSELAYVVDHSAGCGSADGFLHVGSAQLGVWVHLAGTYDGDTMRIYVNGVFMGASAGIGLAPASWMTAGAVTFFDGQQKHFTGELDELRIWTTVRTAAQLQDSMNVTLTGSEPGLIGYWNMDEGSGQSVNDLTQSGTTGTLGITSAISSSDPTWVVSTAPVSTAPVASPNTVLVANFVNGNNAALNSRIYLYNPSEIAGQVTVRVLTLPLIGGIAQELTTTPLNLGILGAKSALNIKLAENILTPLGITTPYITDGGNLTLEFTIQAAGVQGVAQVFSSSLAFGTYPLAIIQ